MNTQYAVAKNPGCFSHEQAASIPLVALTAYACLDWLPPPGISQRKVVIRGASGGTGLFLVQCKLHHLRIIGTNHFLFDALENWHHLQNASTYLPLTSKQ
jgi:NADPH:quinone reductase-like Zn-dependent oxidoreductase